MVLYHVERYYQINQFFIVLGLSMFWKYCQSFYKKGSLIQSIGLERKLRNATYKVYKFYYTEKYFLIPIDSKITPYLEKTIVMTTIM